MKEKNTLLPSEQINEDAQLNKVREVYNGESRFYDITRKLVLKHRKQSIDKLSIKPHQIILDGGCGTGQNFPYIYQLLKGSGKIIGVDCSRKMLGIAKKMIAKNNYQNIELYEADAINFVPSPMIDAAIFSDVLFLIPNFKRALENVVYKLKVGGKVCILDFKVSDNSFLKPLNRPWRKWSNFYGGDFGRKPWKILEQLLGNVQFEEHFFGFRYIASATKRS